MGLDKILEWGGGEGKARETSLRQSGARFARLVYGTRERVPFRCVGWRGWFMARVNACPSDVSVGAAGLWHA